LIISIFGTFSTFEYNGCKCFSDFDWEIIPGPRWSLRCLMDRFCGVSDRVRRESCWSLARKSDYHWAMCAAQERRRVFVRIFRYHSRTSIHNFDHADRTSRSRPHVVNFKFLVLQGSPQFSGRTTLSFLPVTLPHPHLPVTTSYPRNIYCTN
jgi:hypothetical protein